MIFLRSTPSTFIMISEDELMKYIYSCVIWIKLKVHILGIYKIYYYCLLLCLNSNKSDEHM